MHVDFLRPASFRGLLSLHLFGTFADPKGDVKKGGRVTAKDLLSSLQHHLHYAICRTQYRAFFVDEFLAAIQLPISDEVVSNNWASDAISVRQEEEEGKLELCVEYQTTKKAHLAQNCSYFISLEALNHPGQFLG